MTSISRAFFVLMTLISTVASAESRFVGMFDARGTGLFLDSDPRLPKAKVTMPAGHVAAPDLELPFWTTKRYSVPLHSTLSAISSAANERFSGKIEELRRHSESVRMAKDIAPSYGVDPATVIAAIAIELTFNNDYSMKVQNLAAYLPSQSFYPGVADLISKFELP